MICTMSSKTEFAPYYCLLIAICCELDAYEARMVYEHGPNYPPCRRMLKKKVRIGKKEWKTKTQIGKQMQRFWLAGFSINAIAQAFGCYPSTVKRRIAMAERLGQTGEEV